MSRSRLALILLAGVLGGLLSSPRLPGYSVPPFERGLALHRDLLAETLFEEFPVHSKAYYEARNANPGDVDDLAVGLDVLGRSDEAVGVLRAKLSEQLRGGQSGRELYTTYANLGTALIHSHAKAAIAGDEAARAGVEEGLKFVRQSVEVNPEAHFGRERWQMTIVEFLLQAMENPEILLAQDCLGNPLDPGRPVGNLGPGPSYWLVPAERDKITRVGEPEVPFDEPLLGIIGMWQVGGGANPHFALAIGETLDRVGELELAWVAYQRARDLSARFWPDPALQHRLEAYCAARQRLLEAQLGSQEELLDRYHSRLEAGLSWRNQAEEIERQVAADPSLNFYQLYRSLRP